MSTLFRVVLAVAILIAAGHVVAQEDFDIDHETARYWVEKIEIEKGRSEQAQKDIVRLEGEISKAKRRNYPRGKVLREKIDALEKARESGAEARLE